MKKVLLLGDEITLCYRERVKALLSDIAEVVYPDNTGNTATTLWGIRFAYDELCRGSDLIHWNTGLEDHHRHLDDGEPLLTAEQALYLTRRLHRQIACYAPRQIFAATTPAGEHYPYDRDGIYGIPREAWNREVAEYNAVISAYLRNQGVPVNDLYTMMTEHPEYLGEDGLGLSEAGAEAAAQQTAAMIRACLADETAACGAAAAAEAEVSAEKLPLVNWLYLDREQ